MTQQILSDECDGVLTITLNRQSKKNALNSAMYELLIEQFNLASKSENIRCILIQGDETCFCAGNDLEDFVQSADKELVALKFIKVLANFTKPIVAAVAGPAIGIGTTLLLHCDMIIAANNSKFALPFSKLGLCLEAGSSLLLPLKVGANRAFELSVLGERFTADQAYQYGLVNEVCQPQGLLNKAAEIAKVIAALPADSVQTNRRLMRASTANVMTEVLESEGREFVRLLNSPYCQEILLKL